MSQPDEPKRLTRPAPGYAGAVADEDRQLEEFVDNEFDKLVESMKRAAKVLQEAEVPFALAGGLAAWPRGGPQTDHDVDFFVKPDDVERAQEALVDAGMRPEDPPEDWLLKVYDGDVLIDLIFNPTSGAVTDELLARAEPVEVKAMRVPLAPLEDILVTKLLALTEQEPDYSDLLELTRMVREQVDWDEVRDRTHESPFAKAFFTLAEELRLVPADSAQ